MSKIEWTEQTWNPIVGCSIVSPGCTNCYAMKMAARLEAMGVPHYAGLTKSSKAGAVWTGKLALAPEKILLEPLRRRKPTMYFVNSMGDLFHEDVDDKAIDLVMAVIGRCKHHTFQVLTKRASRMRAYMTELRESGRWLTWKWEDTGTHIWDVSLARFESAFSNLWLGISAERQQEADERIPDLLNTPAIVRFVSAEPLLGEINFNNIHGRLPWMPPRHDHFDALHLHQPERLHWIIVGGESGHGARPMHPDWARSIRDRCAVSNVAFFFKQWGSWGVVYDRDKDDPDWRKCDLIAKNTPNGQWLNFDGGQGFHGERVVRVQPMNKTRPDGRLLDGRTHNDMPNTKIVEAA